MFVFQKTFFSTKKRFSQKNFFLSNDSRFPNENVFEKNSFPNKKVLL